MWIAYTPAPAVVRAPACVLDAFNARGVLVLVFGPHEHVIELPPKVDSLVRQTYVAMSKESHGCASVAGVPVLAQCTHPPASTRSRGANFRHAGFSHRAIPAMRITSPLPVFDASTR